MLSTCGTEEIIGEDLTDDDTDLGKFEGLSLLKPPSLEEWGTHRTAMTDRVNLLSLPNMPPHPESGYRQ